MKEGIQNWLIGERDKIKCILRKTESITFKNNSWNINGSIE